jgi:hypothetical protein
MAESWLPDAMIGMSDKLENLTIDITSPGFGSFAKGSMNMYLWFSHQITEDNSYMHPHSPFSVRISWAMFSLDRKWCRFQTLKIKNVLFGAKGLEQFLTKKPNIRSVKVGTWACERVMPNKRFINVLLEGDEPN